jgi:hypothetical protein
VSWSDWRPVRRRAQARRSQAPAHRHALLLPARNLRRPLVRLPRHPDRIQEPQDLRPPLLLGPVLHHDQRILDVLVDREHGYQVEILEDETDVPAAKLGRGAAIERADVGIQHVSVRRSGVTDHVEQRALAAARGTDERGERCGLD